MDILFSIVSYNPYNPISLNTKCPILSLGDDRAFVLFDFMTLLFQKQTALLGVQIHGYLYIECHTVYDGIFIYCKLV